VEHIGAGVSNAGASNRKEREGREVERSGGRCPADPTPESRNLESSGMDTKTFLFLIFAGVCCSPRCA